MALRLAKFKKALEAEGDAIRQIREAEPTAVNCSDEELTAFLMACDMEVPRAVEKFRVANQTLVGHGAVSIAEIAPFMRSPSAGRVVPDGCSVLLEDGKGGVARDKLGRPILMVVGMQHGTKEEMQRQLVYMAARAKEHALPGMPPNAACVVIDVQPAEKGAPPTFRFPDRDVRTLFELQERCYPGALFTTSHFCGLPRFVTLGFRLVKPFFRKETYEAMVLKPSFAHLALEVSPENMLPRWGGTFAFDLDEYVEWRAREEGVDPATLCARGAGKAYDAAKGAAAAAVAIAEASSGGGDGGGVGMSITELLAESDGVLHKGAVSKRGSGRGLFSSVRWKTKLLVLTPGSLCYFDKLDDADPTNKVARMVLIDGSTSVTRLGGASADGRGPAGQFTVRAQARDYLFGVDESAEADAWVAEIEKAIQAVVAGMAQAGMAPVSVQ